MKRYKCINTLVFETGERSFIRGRIYKGFPTYLGYCKCICFKSETSDEHYIEINEFPLYFKFFISFKYGK
jgi:hypothetical protein